LLTWLRSMNVSRVAAFIGLYLFFSYLSIELIHKPGQVTLFWPASGVALVYLVNYGLRWAVPLAISLVLMHSLFNPVPPLFLIFSLLSNMVGAMMAAAYIRSQRLSHFLSLRTCQYSDGQHREPDRGDRLSGSRPNDYGGFLGWRGQMGNWRFVGYYLRGSGFIHVNRQ
jgi:hypothetical protein